MIPQVEHGDCIEVMARLYREGVRFDTCITDGPYHLQSIVDRFGGEDAAPAQVGATGAYARQSAGFMGQQWDGSNEDGRRIAFDPATWRLVLKLLKPGGHLLSFGHTRTQHRMVCAVEDAGFEIRDQLAWTYASGFPKSKNVGLMIDKRLGFARDADEERVGPYRAQSEEAKPWEGYGTALKPAWEPICLARKPLVGSIGQNVMEYGVGGLDIEGCRIGWATPDDEAEAKRKNAHGKFDSGPRTNLVFQADNHPRADYDAAGRWPANLITDGSPEVHALFPTTAPARSGRPRSGQAGVCWAMTATGAEYDDAGGSAARFFFSAKADKSDRVSRCRICGTRYIGERVTCHLFDEEGKPAAKGKPQVDRHPTVKPLALMQYLAKLSTPPGGLILDPFAGTGSTGIAADREGMRSVLIEQSAEYVGDIHFRIAQLSGANTPLFMGRST